MIRQWVHWSNANTNANNRNSASLVSQSRQAEATRGRTRQHEAGRGKRVIPAHFLSQLVRTLPLLSHRFHPCQHNSAVVPTSRERMCIEHTKCRRSVPPVDARPLLLLLQGASPHEPTSSTWPNVRTTNQWHKTWSWSIYMLGDKSQLRRELLAFPCGTNAWFSL